MKRSDAIMNAFICLCDGDMEECAEILRRDLAFDPMERPPKVDGNSIRSIKKVDLEASGDKVDATTRVRTFINDGFINRFDGGEVVLPACLKLLSHQFPDLLPHQMNWKIGLTHMVYYDICACANKRDHSKVGRFGPQDLITTTMPRVMARSNISLEAIGWNEHPAGDIKEWDGLSLLFLDYVSSNPELKKISFVRTWYPPVKRAFGR